MPGVVRGRADAVRVRIVRQQRDRAVTVVAVGAVRRRRYAAERRQRDERRGRDEADARAKPLQHRDHTSKFKGKVQRATCKVGGKYDGRFALRRAPPTGVLVTYFEV
jgi:hypothetical protein